MNAHLRTGTFLLEINEADFEVAHLYEHLLIQSFKGRLKKLGLSPYLYGWVSGETFPGVMFIEYGLYSEEVEKIFLDHISTPHRIDMKLLDIELLRIQAESRSVMGTYDKALVMKQLNLLDAASFANAADILNVRIIPPVTRSQDALTLRRSKKDFRDMTITIGVARASEEEMALFFRLIPLLADAVNDVLFDKGLYEQEVSWPIRNVIHNSILFYSLYSIKRNTSNNTEIQRLVRKAIQSIDIASHIGELNAYKAGFLTTPNWHTFPIDYYRHTQVLTSRNFVAEQLTAHKIASIIKKVEVRVSPTKPEDAHYVKA